VKVALVHDWLVSSRGGERVLLELARVFPDASIFTLVHQPGSVDAELEQRPINTSFIQHLPGAPRAFRRYLPLFWAAVRRFDFSRYDLVVSTSHCVAMAAQTHGMQLHVSYIHSPMRYLSDQQRAYIPRSLLGKNAKSRRADVVAAVVAAATVGVRKMDRRLAAGPDVLLCNSDFVRQRIARVWQRDAQVVYPPVDVEFFASGEGNRGADGFLLCLGALVPYKRVDLAVDYANSTGRKLVVAGQGPELESLQKRAGPSVSFVAAPNRLAVRKLYQEARALLFCGEEDFGIVPVEASAAGLPVVAFGRGGALETVGEQNGALFGEQTIAALGAAVDDVERRLDSETLTQETISKAAQPFTPSAFREQIQGVVAALK